MKLTKVLCALAVALTSSPALADVITPDETPCVLKASGDLCTAMGAGLGCAPDAACTCVGSLCPRTIYVCDAGSDGAAPDGGPDAGALDASSGITCLHLPGMVPCLVCRPSPEDAGVDATVDAGVDATVDAGVDATADSGLSFDATLEDAEASSGGGGAPSGGGCSCSVHSVSALRILSPWLLAALVPPLVLRRRRRT
jgi:hypothetical protein